MCRKGTMYQFFENSTRFKFNIPWFWNVGLLYSSIYSDVDFDQFDLGEALSFPFEISSFILVSFNWFSFISLLHIHK